MPGDGRAAVAEGPAEVPGEEGETEDPKNQEREIGEEVVFGVQREGDMEDGGCYEGDYGEERDSKELDWRSVQGSGSV